MDEQNEIYPYNGIHLKVDCSDRFTTAQIYQK